MVWGHLQHNTIHRKMFILKISILRFYATLYLIGDGKYSNFSHLCEFLSSSYGMVVWKIYHQVLLCLLNLFYNIKLWYVVLGCHIYLGARVPIYLSMFYFINKRYHPYMFNFYRENVEACVYVYSFQCNCHIWVA